MHLQIRAPVGLLHCGAGLQLRCLYLALGGFGLGSTVLLQNLSGIALMNELLSISKQNGTMAAVPSITPEKPLHSHWSQDIPWSWLWPYLCESKP
jgi:hypothetical protein